MKKILTGKTKDLFLLNNGNYLMQFKDTLTGKDGVFDPGANTVGLSIAGMGRQNLLVSRMFFDILAEKGIATHYISCDTEKGTMEVIPTKPFGEGLEVICRYRAVGSFLRRYGKYVKEGEPLDAYVETTLKDDEREDPLITPEGLEALNIMDKATYKSLESLTKKIASVVAEIVKSKGMELYDIKFEFGTASDGRLLLIDEIASGNMRVYRDGKYVEPMGLSSILLSDMSEV